MLIPTYDENTNSQASGNYATINLKWRYKTTITYYPAGDIRESKSVGGIFSPASHRPGEEVETEDIWTIGGVANPSNRVCTTTVASLADAIFLYKTSNKPDGVYYYAYFDWKVRTTQVVDVEIDWEDFATKLRLAKPLSQNLSVVGMGNTYDGESVDYIQSGMVSGQFLTNLYQNNSDVTVEPLMPSIQPTTWGKPVELDVNGALPEDIKPQHDETSGGTPATYPNNETYNSATCQGNKTSIPMVVKVYLGNKEDPDKDNKDPDTGLIANKADMSAGSPSVGNVSNWDAVTSFSGESVTSDLGSDIGGLNLIELLNGNSVLPFDSVYFTAEDYTSFVSAGGGMVGESGIFPNSSSIWISTISPAVTGNTMSILQNTDFDSTPLLTVGERIFGYIINQSGDYQPSFAGWVTSMKRVMDGNAEKIEYSCNCLKYYLDQLYTPSFYKYVPSSTDTTSNLSVEYIIKKMLVRAGVTIGDIDISSISAPAVNWNFESLSNVLNWAQGFLGKHVYYVDKNGILNFKATDSGSLIKSLAIPTRGASITAGNKVLSFMPLTDLTRSRSKIILVGDFPLTELSGERTFVYPYDVNTNPVDVTTTGVYKFVNKFGASFYYLMWKSSKTIVNELISNPEKAAEFIKLRDNYTVAPDAYSTSDKNIDLEIAQLSTVEGRSFIYIWKMMYPGARSTMTTYRGNVITHPYSTDISYRYVVKEDAPLSITVSTGLTGGAEVVKMPEFKKVTSDSYVSDDTALMQEYANTIKEYYKPIYGGTLVLDGLDTDMELLGKVSVTNTSLPADEATSLFIYSITYDCVAQKTTLELSNKTYLTLPYFSKQEELTINKARDNKILTDTTMSSVWTAARN